METSASYLRFVRDSLFTGIGFLLVITPASAMRWEDQGSQTPTDFTRHFAEVAGYIRAAIAVEAPQLLVDLKTEEEKQLEFRLHA